MTPPRKLSVWQKTFRFSAWVLSIGSLVGLTAKAFLGREFTNEELGILLWPAAGLYLFSFFYVLTYLVFVCVQGKLRAVVITLWGFMMVLIAVVLLSVAFGWGREPHREARTTSGAATTTAP